jgi:hypothetical protein
VRIVSTTSPALTLGLLVVLCAAATPTIRMEAGGYRVVGWNPGSRAPSGGWSSVFAVYAGDGDAPAMLGVYSIEDGSLVFRPRFPLSAGVRVRAVFHPPHGPAVEAVFEAAKADLTASTRVQHVYPSTDVLPDNQLKFYLFFSAPMQRGEAWRRIHLLKQDGTAVELPFLEQELWDRDNQRLTVLFDPGRIKRGLLPLQEVGPAIEEGKQYTLVVDKEWRDARGAPLREGYRKPFRAGPADRTSPEPAQWRLSAPQAGTSDALVVSFPKPMDYALLLRLLEVPGVAGTASVDREETEWRFTPSEPWRPGAYNLVIDTALEDLAGNRIGQAFDVDIFEKVSEHLTSKTISLPFRISGQ